MRVVNPATEEVIEEYEWHSAEHVERALGLAGETFRAWRWTTTEHRAGLMRAAAGVLRARSAELAALMTREMGKPVTVAEAEVEKCAAACEFFAEHAGGFLADEPVPTDATRSYVRYEPLGAVFAIMPWNFPFWQVVRFAAPALMAGNVGVLKHAPNVPGCARAVEDVFRAAGFPPGVFTNLFLDDAAAAGVIRHPVVRAVTLTGSERAGRSVAATAAAALKKTVLELGGSDAFIVVPPAGRVDHPFLQAVALAAVQARCLNSGQSCVAAKRFIVVGGGDNARFFETLLAMGMESHTARVGDPADRATLIGPLARLDLLENLHDQVRRSVERGARLLLGGERMNRKGYFYPPTVLTGVRPGMPAFDEETFGPVAAVIDARDVEEAIDLANASPYGLGASIWTSDLAIAERLAPRIEAGCVFVNGAVKSDPRLPFGGVKHSGYGRELSAAGIREFVNVKTVWTREHEARGAKLRRAE